MTQEEQLKAARWQLLIGLGMLLVWIGADMYSNARRERLEQQRHEDLINIQMERNAVERAKFLTECAYSVDTFSVCSSLANGNEGALDAYLKAAKEGC